MEGIEGMSFITPIQKWDPLEQSGVKSVKGGASQEASMFRSVFDNVVEQVYSTQAEVEEKQYLLATGQLDDAHSLPIAEAKAGLSLDVLISLRNKAMESYNELIKMGV